MFMWDCIKSEGLHLGTCSDRFLFGSCCYHNATYNDIDIQRPNSSTTLHSDSHASSESQKVSTIPLSGSMEPITLTSLYTQQQTTQAPSLQQNQETSTLTFLQSTSSLSDHISSLDGQELTSLSNETIKSPEQVWQSAQVHHSSDKTGLPTVSIFESSTTWPTSSSTDSVSTESPTKRPSKPFMYVKPLLTVTTTQSATSNDTPNHHTSDLQTTTASSSATLIKQQPSQQINSSFNHLQGHSQLIHNNNHNPSPSSPVQQYQQQQQQPMKPVGQTSSWLSRPASLLANAFFHSFKPFPYLNPNRLKPTYRPFMAGGYRPIHYRPPAPSHQRPHNPTIGNSVGFNQQSTSSHPINDMLGGSSSETSLSSSQLSAPSMHEVANMTNQVDNSDHHIVNPASSMTNRYRPMDKTPFGDNLNMVQKQNHYDIVNASSHPDQGASDHIANGTSHSSSTSSSTTYPHQYPGSYEHTSVVSLSSLDQDSNVLDEPANHTVMSVSFQTPERPLSTELNQAADQTSQTSATVSSYNPSYHSKPVILLDRPSFENQTVQSYPSYPLISSYPPSSNQQQHSSMISDPQFSTLGSIDEIHGLSVGQPYNSSGNSTSSLTYESINGHMEANNQSLNETTLSHGDSIVTSPHLDRPGSFQSGLGGDSHSTTSGLNASTIALLSTTESPSPSYTSVTPSFDSISTSSISTPSRISSTMAAIAASGDSKRGSGNSGHANKEVACGVTALYPQTKVVGGKNAAFGAWPWQVSVRKVSFFGFSSTHRCGGAVISSEWIATAGHCVEDLALQSIRIRVGEYDFSSVSEPFPYIERAARRKVVHPKYNFYTYENDLALVQLDQPIVFPPHIAPICLPPDNIDLLGRNATVTGWGRLNEGGTLPTILQEVRVPIVSNDKCKDMFLSAGRPEYIPDIFLCAGYEEGGRDSCQGDSGGPLQVKGDDGKWFLAGIISWGIGCAEQNLPGVCTRISRFKLWIQSTMGSSA